MHTYDNMFICQYVSKYVFVFLIHLQLSTRICRCCIVVVFTYKVPSLCLPSHSLHIHINTLLMSLTRENECKWKICFYFLFCIWYSSRLLLYWCSYSVGMYVCSYFNFIPSLSVCLSVSFLFIPFFQITSACLPQIKIHSFVIPYFHQGILRYWSCGLCIPTDFTFYAERNTLQEIFLNTFLVWH